MHLALGTDAARAWDGLDRKARNQVRKAEKSGLTWRRGGVELLDRFYGVFARNMRDLGTPVYSRRFFEHVLSTFPATSSVCLVDHGDRTVAGAIALSHRDVLEVPWASSLREYRSQCPNNLLYWRIIEHAIASGRPVARLRPVDAERGNVSLQGAVGRQAGAALLGIRDAGARHAAGSEPRESEISRRDRGVDAAAARDREPHRSAHRQVDPVMTRSVSEKRDYASSRPASSAKTRATEGEASQDGACDTAIRIAYAAAAAGFVAYAVWGTLFPFDFHAVPLETAALLFWSRRAIDAGSLSLTDLVSNVLLFLPIGLFMSAALEFARGELANHERWAHLDKLRTSGTPIHALTRDAPFSIAITLAAAIALSGIIEFLQAFVSWRTPSILDVAAEVLGAACGVAIWRYVRTELDALLRAALGTIGRSTPLERILLAGCAALAIAWWLPADFTLRPDEIGDKYFHKRLLLPFTPSPDAATPSELATIAVAAVPLGLAAVLCGADRTAAGRSRAVRSSRRWRSWRWS